MEVFLNHLALERSVSASSIQTQALKVHVPKRDMNDRKRCITAHSVLDHAASCCNAS